MKKFFRISVWILVTLVLLVAVGPRITYQALETKKSLLNIEDISSLDDYIENKESQVEDLKPDNEARIIWADSTKKKTDYSVVYLHGFSASQEEGDPIHENFAKRYGANLYLSRLYDHGRLDSNTFKGLTPNLLYKSAEEALEIGEMIGEKVIIMCCSTGGTLDIMLSHYHPEIFAHIMYSPNIAIFDPLSSLITKPWGEQVMDQVMGGEYNRIIYSEAQKQYWNPIYHTDGIMAVQYMLDNYMTDEYFKTIKQPLFVGVYYKDEDHQDKVVSVSAARNMFDAVATPIQNKRWVEFPDAGRHVISSHLFSNDIKNVQDQTYKFAEEVLGLKPVTAEVDLDVR
jgi:pimeloyl-ACP methyl ester carboxylesterase